MVNPRGTLAILTVAGLLLQTGATAWAQAVPLPGGADASRIEERVPAAPPPPLAPSLMQTVPGITVEAPAQSRSIPLELKAVKIEGMTAFTEAQVHDIYAPYLFRNVTLDIAWMIAGQLTERYRNAGYFLSRAYVPAQDIKDGVLTIRVVEGYIGAVVFDDEETAHLSPVESLLQRLQAYRPLKAQQIESILLQLNDLPGISLQAVLEPIGEDNEEGAVKLTLVEKAVPRVSGQIGIDNNGSRFLGPNEGYAQIQARILPLQTTTLTLLSSLPWDEVKYGMLKHELPLFAGATGEIYASRTAAAPGFTLKPQEIDSDSTLYGGAVSYKLIRQRQENLSARVALESRDTKVDILNIPITRDHIRAARFGLDYQTLDGWNGSNAFGFILSQGIDGFGSSDAGDFNLSRAGAKPDFTKINLTFARNQNLANLHDALADIDLVTAASAQLSRTSLFSSEEFGYGGQSFGRAYDDSEILGDNGVNGSAELRYRGLSLLPKIDTIPYTFYDIGTVWQHAGGSGAISGSSAGVGLRLANELGFQGNLAVAWPLTRDIATPLYGSKTAPRLTFQALYSF